MKKVALNPICWRSGSANSICDLTASSSVSTTVLAGTRSAARQSMTGLKARAREAKIIKILGQAYLTADFTPDPDLQIRGMLAGSACECSRKTYRMTVKGGLKVGQGDSAK